MEKKNQETKISLSNPIITKKIKVCEQTKLKRKGGENTYIFIEKTMKKRTEEKFHGKVLSFY
jgi:hypothetical protein